MAELMRSPLAGGLGLVLILAVLVLAVFLLSWFSSTGGDGFDFSADGLMEIVKTDKDYGEFLNLTPGFEPEVVSYAKLGPSEYVALKPLWDANDSDMNGVSALVDQLTLTDSTYLVEFRNRGGEGYGLLAVLDLKERKSLLLIASLKVDVGVGL